MVAFIKCTVAMTLHIKFGDVSRNLKELAKKIPTMFQNHVWLRDNDTLGVPARAVTDGEPVTLPSRTAGLMFSISLFWLHAIWHFRCRSKILDDYGPFTLWELFFFHTSTQSHIFIFYMVFDVIAFFITQKKSE